MISNLRFKNTLVLFLTTCLFMAMAPSVAIIQKAYDPTGTWNYEVETPEGTLTGEMKITKSENEFEVIIESDVYGTLELEEVALEGNVMEASLELEGDLLDFEFEFDGDSMEGVVYSGEDELSISAERKN